MFAVNEVEEERELLTSGMTMLPMLGLRLMISRRGGAFSRVPSLLVLVDNLPLSLPEVGREDCSLVFPTL